MRLIDADALTMALRRAEAEAEQEYGISYSPIGREILIRLCDGIGEMPTIDAVPVVRCKDCDHWYQVQMPDGNSVFCVIDNRITSADDFCSWGERKEG